MEEGGREAYSLTDHIKEPKEPKERLREAGMDLYGRQEMSNILDRISNDSLKQRLEHNLKINPDFKEIPSDVVKDLTDILDKINNMSNGPDKDKAYFDFKAEYWEFLLEPRRLALLRREIDEKLELISPNEEADEEADEEVGEEADEEADESNTPVVAPIAEDADLSDVMNLSKVSKWEMLKEKQKEISLALRDGNIATAIALAFSMFGTLSDALMEKWQGIVESEVESPVNMSQLESAKNNTAITGLYEFSGGKITQLKYNSFADIVNSSESVGDKVAAAALLGVFKNIDCDNAKVDPARYNHCSGWVDTIAKKAGLSEGRYNARACAFVNTKYSEYSAWAKNAVNRKDSISEIGGLKPGDMVIYENGNAYTGFHDAIYLGNDLWASQNISKGVSGVRTIFKKKLDPNKIAVVTRPGFNSYLNV